MTGIPRHANHRDRRHSINGAFKTHSSFPNHAVPHMFHGYETAYLGEEVKWQNGDGVPKNGSMDLLT
jgi:hypothetical protein